MIRAREGRERRISFLAIHMWAISELQGWGDPALRYGKNGIRPFSREIGVLHPIKSGVKKTRIGRRRRGAEGGGCLRDE